jgi:uncharacterized membrane protein
MGTRNVELMRMARESLKDKWGMAILTFVVYMIVVSAIQFIPIIGQVAILFVGGPFAVGLAIYFLAISRNQEAKLEQIFMGFQNFVNAFLAYLLMMIFVLLWMLLLIVPGIIAALSYSMTMFIIADDSNISAMDALRKSKKMMDGFKWKYFCLGLRFLGWALLCILTLGIGFFWLFPYMQTSMAKFYDDVKAIYEGNTANNPIVNEPSPYQK